MDDDQKIGNLKNKLLNLKTNIVNFKNFRIEPCVFKKDNDINHHLDFINTGTNLF